MTQSLMYQKNMEFLNSQNCSSADHCDERFPLNDVQVNPAKTDGYFFLESKSEEGKVCLLNSKYDPCQEAKAWAAQQDLDGKKHVLMYGLGLGYHAEALVERYPEIMLYVYEPDIRLLLSALHQRDWTAFPWKNIGKLVLDEAGQKIGVFIKEIFTRISGDWTFLVIPAFSRCYALAYTELKEKFRQYSQIYILSLNAGSTYQKEWTINALKNIPSELHLKPIFAYREQFSKQTVVMVASGPSLDAAIPYLRLIKQKRKAVILAIGTAVNVLLKNDLPPDFHISYDPSEENYIVLSESLAKNIPLIFGSTIRHEIVKNHQGPKAYFVLSQDSVLSYLTGVVPQDQVVEDAASIAVPTLQLLDKLQVKRVVLAGQDLAFYEDYNYAQGASVLLPDGKVLPADKKEYVAVGANNGETVFTTPVYNNIRTRMEEVISAGQFSAVFNPSVHGAKISGTQFVPWETVVENLPDGGFGQEIVFTVTDSGRPIRKMRKTMLSILDRFDDILNRIQRQLDKVLAMDESLEKSLQEKQYKILEQELGHFTSSLEYKCFVLPMVRVENHIMQKALVDFFKLPAAEKKEVINHQLGRFLSGVRLSLLQLRQTVDEWK